ncbi:uncharacterized protein LOC122040637 [Zingiber officinale]|uniref:RING-type E3 ubiquitin transferase n=1 Tax=Zingiber officinale TaxID=94328 RepID=A0A8J5LSC7_ZINOF|nr:uncharacterized protein LOC122040637 [Zingiber officinale]KAG6532679.1 hypothetical protein ZIOFF_006529 [Zingiber officinale]
MFNVGIPVLPARPRYFHPLFALPVSSMATTCFAPLSRASPLSVIVLLFLLFSFTTSSDVLYSEHCSSVVSESAVSDDALDPSASAHFQLSSGVVFGADALLGGNSSVLPAYFFFRLRSLLPTQTLGVVQIAATLILRSGGSSVPVRGRHVLGSSDVHFHQVRPRLPRTFFQRGMVSLDLTGVWSEASGKLCMVGNGRGRSLEGNNLQVSALLKLDYPKVVNITSSLIKGSLQSLDAPGSLNHFDQVSVLAYAPEKYEYTQISHAKNSCNRVNDESLGLQSVSLCYYLRSLSRVRFELDYEKNCSTSSCGPFAPGSRFTPRTMSFHQTQCSDDGLVHAYVGFSNYDGFSLGTSLIPGKVLVSEGFWDPVKHQLCLVACRIQNSGHLLEDSTVDACTIRICLWFPAVWSIENRSISVGRIWSNNNEKFSGYFDPVSFWSIDNYMGSLPGLNYNYTRLELARKSCVSDSSKSARKKKYPDGKSFRDFRFDASARNSQGNSTWCYFNPVSIGQTIYGNMFVQNEESLPVSVNVESYSLQNISYEIQLMLSNSSFSMNKADKISAEGIYNAHTGLLCLVGCRVVAPLAAKQQMKRHETMDCEIIINIQLAPLNRREGDKINGTIRSTRDNKDPLFIEPLDITSSTIYIEQATQSIWRMDVELIMVMVSLTSSCIFVGLQLFHVKKKPEVLPSISIIMLVILTLGYMIPLVLNFQALFRPSSNQNVFLWSGGWLEVNEVIVRVVTMIAFLLQFRFLQLSWTARSSNEGTSGLWLAEKNTIKTCLPLYLVGGLIAWLVHTIYSQSRIRRRPLYANQLHDSLWGSLISYASLILDGFLLPQVIFNVFSGSKEKALAPSFYVGNTVVRGLPHAYDAYRSRYYVPPLNSSYIYASPYEGFYSMAWDIIVPCGGILLALLVFLQQRYGGCFISPKNIEPRTYELVPVVVS